MCRKKCRNRRNQLRHDFIMENKEKDEQFAERLFKLRSALPSINRKIVGQKVVAERVGISEGSYNRAERGYIPGKAVLFSLAIYFNVTVDYLKGEEVDHIPEELLPHQEIKYELQDGEFPWGKTRQHDIKGTPPLIVTEFKPKEGQVTGPLRGAIEGLGEIFDSNDPILIPAIQAKIRTFQLSARREQQNAQQARQIKALQDECDELKKRFDALEKTCAQTSTPGPKRGNIDRKVI